MQNSSANILINFGYCSGFCLCLNLAGQWQWGLKWEKEYNAAYASLSIYYCYLSDSPLSLDSSWSLAAFISLVFFEKEFVFRKDDLFKAALDSSLGFRAKYVVLAEMGKELFQRWLGLESVLSNMFLTLISWILSLSLFFFLLTECF